MWHYDKRLCIFSSASVSSDLKALYKSVIIIIIIIIIIKWLHLLSLHHLKFSASKMTILRTGRVKGQISRFRPCTDRVTYWLGRLTSA